MKTSSGRKKKLVSLLLVSLLIAAGIAYILLKNRGAGNEEETATIDDLIASSSERSQVTSDLFLASYSNRFFPLIATPLSVYFSGEEKHSSPMLVAGENSATQDVSVSTAVTRFLDAYPDTDGSVIGPLEPGVEQRLMESGLKISHRFDGDPETVSLAAARTFWKSSDGAVVIHDCRKGYDAGMPAATLASYLNIPVIICDDIRDAEPTLDRLQVKYTIICGPLKGYGRVMRMEDSWDVIDALALGMPSRDGTMRSLMADRLSIDPNYIVLANPMDTVIPRVVDSFEEHFEGEITSTSTGSTSDPSLSPDAVVHHLEIPEDYQWARVRMTAALDFIPSPIPRRTPEDDGQRGYLYFGVDEDSDGEITNDQDSENDHLELMAPTLSYSYMREGNEAVKGIAHTEEPLFNAQGTHAVEMLATLAYDPLGREETTTYSIDVTVEKLDMPNHPLMPFASVNAPYLAVNREGLVLSSEKFSIFENETMRQQRYFGDPTVDPHALDNGWNDLSGLIGISNDVAKGVKRELNSLLSSLSGESETDPVALAELYGSRLESDPFFVGILGGTNMIPQYYYPTEGQGDLPQEGYGIAGDMFYSSIDTDTENDPDDENGNKFSADIAVGRIDGWDAQDISALICRTLFYDSIIDSFEGLHGLPWKDSAINNFGSEIPVGASITVSEKISEAEQRSGFTVDNKHYSPLSDSRLTRDLYQRSNFIYFCAHGFYYWFVPPGYKPTSVGGSYNVANVIDMNFGPSIIFGSSCVTGKVDGIEGYNALSQAFLHSGMNAYIGASRLSWGSAAIIPDMESGEAFGNYLGLLFYGYLTGYLYDKQGHLIFETDGDMTVGQSIALAKNMFVEKAGYSAGNANADTLEEFNLHGDPAFNPYEPNHNG
ncbi:hypothetical protein B6U90_06145 [Thermoplasmatales archaeon ex4484_6]|nr:MAG: hypothetical protein B6U90_06145 [Thermoplasmatales archaeon ex4484_6]RLF69614.1 MAG: hypothetical protein DRN57_00325 [Thermoplasmata archaeon]